MKQDLIVDLSADKHKVNPTIAVHQGEVTLLFGGDNKVSDPLCTGYLLNIDLATEAVDNGSHGFTLTLRTSGVMAQSSPAALFSLRDLIAFSVSSNVGWLC